MKTSKQITEGQETFMNGDGINHLCQYIENEQIRKAFVGLCEFDLT